MNWDIAAYVAGAFIAGFATARLFKQLSRANKTLEDIRAELRVVVENQDEERHERQMEEERQHDRENDSEGR